MNVNESNRNNIEEHHNHLSSFNEKHCVCRLMFFLSQAI